MGLLDFLGKELTVNEGINRARSEKGAVLLDVRRKEDFKKGYVAGAINVPLERLDNVKNRIRDLSAPIYVIGSYSDNPKEAVKKLKKMGYTQVICSGRMEEHYGLLKKQG